MSEEIQMAPGGEWMSEGGAGTPHYVVHPDHIKRLHNEGYHIVPDPRIPVERTPFGIIPFGGTGDPGGQGLDPLLGPDPGQEEGGPELDPDHPDRTKKGHKK